MKQEIWDPVRRALIAAEETINKLAEDPVAWGYWCIIGGGEAGERLLQLLKAVLSIFTVEEVTNMQLQPIQHQAHDISMDIASGPPRSTLTFPCCIIQSAVGVMYSTLHWDTTWPQLQLLVRSTEFVDSLLLSMLCFHTMQMNLPSNDFTESLCCVQTGLRVVSELFDGPASSSTQILLTGTLKALLSYLPVAVGAVLSCVEEGQDTLWGGDVINYLSDALVTVSEMQRFSSVFHEIFPNVLDILTSLAEMYKLVQDHHRPLGLSASMMEGIVGNIVRFIASLIILPQSLLNDFWAKYFASVLRVASYALEGMVRDEGGSSKLFVSCITLLPKTIQGNPSSAFPSDYDQQCPGFPPSHILLQTSRFNRWQTSVHQRHVRGLGDWREAAPTDGHFFQSTQFAAEGGCQ